MPSIDASLGRLKEAFEQIIEENIRGGAALSLWHEGTCLLSLQGGEASPGKPWTNKTPCLIWSASKGVAAACALHALQEKGIPLETSVSSLWPEFAANGKESVTLAELLSHRAGLAAINQRGLSITDHEAVAKALAEQPPNWSLHAGEASHGYGARTFGLLLDEIIRRVSGEPLTAYWERVFRKPLGLDLWFGLPEALLEETALVIAPKMPPLPSSFTKAFADPSSLTRRALSEPNSPLGTLTPTVMNTPEMRRASIPSLGAISTADALASFYALLSSPNTLFTPATQLLMKQSLAKGIDLTLQEETAFSAGFMTNDYAVYGPNASAFGHPGAGGSLAFADPALKIGFAFIPSGMNPGALPGPRTQKLLHALYGISGAE